LHIADGTIFAAQCGLANSIKEPNQMYMGSPAFNLKAYQRSSIVFKTLPDLQKMVFELQRKITEMEFVLQNK